MISKLVHPNIVDVVDFYTGRQMRDDCLSRVRVAMLVDYDVTSCYDIINTKTTFTLDLNNSVLESASNDETIVSITTKTMPCGDKFHINVYQQPYWSNPCKVIPNVCTLISEQDIDVAYHNNQFYKCDFLCSCKTSDCPHPHLVYIEAAHPKLGGVCDVTTEPYQ